MSEITLYQAKQNPYFIEGTTQLQENLNSFGTTVNNNTKDPGGENTDSNNPAIENPISLPTIYPSYA